MEPSRPLPEPTVVTRPFWEAAAQRRLLAPRCRACGRWFFPPHLVCPHCREADWEWAQSSGRGELYSFTVVHRAPQPGFDPPYVLAVVDLEEGFELMTNIVGADPAGLRIGQRVRVTWQEAGDMVLPVFTPADGGTA
ncbi:OB-fold domain-containing protein [Ornithinimicrobium humiphilum]|uniref:OB-fold protein n=1 Tax=Ornithinimicrobium humiphilum TaxID=125288 RepID=A0A543KRT3_9MICO|nr:Zn-ribbon domain-containing OB-fold protein [Ornithinimicrobium humiphilum]TQM97784.1 hypothetical protein FB476_2709 [Ornithinimicrobium humiphilum]